MRLSEFTITFLFYHSYFLEFVKISFNGELAYLHLWNCVFIKLVQHDMGRKKELTEILSERKERSEKLESLSLLYQLSAPALPISQKSFTIVAKSYSLSALLPTNSLLTLPFRLCNQTLADQLILPAPTVTGARLSWPHIGLIIYSWILIKILSWVT